MSRMALPALLLFASPAVADTAAMDTYLDLTRVEPRCQAAVGGEILVCGRREADKYRVPLITPPPAGSPRIVDVHAERAKLIAIETPCQQRGPHLVGCGMVGVTMSTKLGGTGKVEVRPIAP